MTPLSDPKTGRAKVVTRDTGVLWRRLELQVRLMPEGLYLKGKKQRWSSAYFLPWAAAYDTAVMMKVAEQRRERAERRKARRAA